MTERASIVNRWETAKENAQTSPDMGPGPSNADRLEQTRETLRSEHAGIWGALMEQAEQTKVDLRTGPSKDTLERMVEAGLLITGQIATYGDYYPGMMSDELDGNESPQSVNIWWNALSEEEREQARANEPDLLRGLDGIPRTCVTSSTGSTWWTRTRTSRTRSLSSRRSSMTSPTRPEIVAIDRAWKTGSRIWDRRNRQWRRCTTASETVPRTAISISWLSKETSTAAQLSPKETQTLPIMWQPWPLEPIQPGNPSRARGIMPGS